MNKYLVSSKIIDWDNLEIMKKAKELSQNKGNPVDIAKSCFEYVRDGIKHSNDYQLNPVTCKALYSNTKQVIATQKAIY